MTRLLGSLLVIALLGPAAAECAGWSAVAADRHACCTRGGADGPATLTSCCTMAPQSNDATAPESHATRTSLQPLPSFASHALDAVARDSVLRLDHAASRRPAPSVPIYLQQASLLI